MQVDLAITNHLINLWIGFLDRGSVPYLVAEIHAG